MAELDKAAWVPRDGLEITVTNGIVDLNGVILDGKEREALRVVAENTPGVRGRRGSPRLDRAGLRHRHRSTRRTKRRHHDVLKEESR